MQWGWNPDTVAAITTALAAAAAVVAGFFAGGAYRAEREARQLAKSAHQLAEDAHQASKHRELRAQAESVSAWAHVNDDDAVELLVQNQSAAPVYAVRLGLVHSNGAGVYAGWMRVAPPTRNTPTRLVAKDLAVAEWRKWERRQASRLPPYVEFTFRDSKGHWWYRDGQGVLTSTTEDEAYRYEKRADDVAGD